MRVGTRLFLAVMPAVIGVLSVAGLAYYGEYGRQAPNAIVAVAAIASIGSMIVAWRNTRYVARRIESLLGVRETPPERVNPFRLVREAAQPGSSNRSPDELDSIAGVVDRLSGAVETAEAQRQRDTTEAARRVEEYAALLAETTSAVAGQLEEVRLPLHILLETRFGELNPNQEEMLVAAETAARKATDELRRLRDLADIDRGALRPRRDSIRCGDLIESLLPTLRAEAQRLQVRIETDIAPALPRVAADRPRLQEALASLLSDRVQHADPGSAISLKGAPIAGRVELVIEHGPMPATGPRVALARRVIEVNGGTMDEIPGRTVISLPVATMS